MEIWNGRNDYEGEDWILEGEEPMGQADSVNALSRKEERYGRKRVPERLKSNSSCYSCGENWPHLGECPAKDRECTSCGSFGHCIKFCNRRVQSQSRRSQYQGQQGSRFESRQHANMRDTEEYESDQEHVLSLQAGIQPDLYAFSVCRGPSDKDKVMVLVDRVPLRMLPDTPATPKYAYSEQFFNR